MRVDLPRSSAPSRAGRLVTIRQIEVPDRLRSGAGACRCGIGIETAFDHADRVKQGRSVRVAPATGGDVETDRFSGASQRITVRIMGAFLTDAKPSDAARGPVHRRETAAGDALPLDVYIATLSCPGTDLGTRVAGGTPPVRGAGLVLLTAPVPATVERPAGGILRRGQNNPEGTP